MRLKPTIGLPTAARLCECAGCGLLHEIPALAPGMAARCTRCGKVLHRSTKQPPGRSAALVLAATALLTIMCLTSLMGVSTAGMSHQAGLLSGPVELVARGMAPLAAVVVFVTLIAPFGRLLGTLYVLVRLHEKKPRTHLAQVFLWAERLRPWSMIEVFLFGVFVAYVKLGDLVTITLEVGVYALAALTLVLIWLDAGLDREAIWDRIGHRPRAEPADRRRLAGAIACEACELVDAGTGGHRTCSRCGSALHRRKPDSIARTWALVIAAAVLYVPANYYPVLTVMQLGAGAPSTILGGVEELISSRMYPLAVLVFFASIAVPMLKMVGLTVMLVSTQLGRTAWLIDRTRLYYVVRWIGRWSMIDIFMEALLGALVKFGAVITIEPGMGALAFCGVVILTMFAAETFDPRLMWDAAAERRGAAVMKPA